jgi:methylase of polypeptide subunit release factors
VVDLGGGHGGFITAILQAHPSVRGILTDLDRALPGAGAHLAANGLADRCDVVACDFFTDPLPSRRRRLPAGARHPQLE